MEPQTRAAESGSALIAAWRRGLNDCNGGSERDRRGREGGEGREREAGDRFQKTIERLTGTVRLYRGTLVIIRQRYA